MEWRYFPNLKLTKEHFAIDNVKELILFAAENQDFQKNWKPETKYNKILEQGQSYWDDLVMANGRQILTLQQYETITNIVSSLYG